MEAPIRQGRKARPVSSLRPPSDGTIATVGLFWTALVPQILVPGAGVLPKGAFAVLAGRLRPALARPLASRVVNGLVGVLLMALATSLAVAH